jgi:hypothetical protein
MSQAATLEKDAQQSRIYFFDFSLWAELIAGASLSTATIAANFSELVIGAVTVTKSLAQARISGGNKGRVYDIKCIATTTAGDMLVQRGFLSVT